MSDPNGEARKLLDDADDMHRCTPAERVARAQVFAILAQAEASQAMVELLSRIANALERAHPDSASGPGAGLSRVAPRQGPSRSTTLFGGVSQAG
jgi:hypothetical protein